MARDKAGHTSAGLWYHLKRWFSDMTLRQKLTSVIMLTCLTALMLVGGSLIIWQWIILRRNLMRDLVIQAQMIAENCQAAVAFEDAEDAAKTLASLRAKTSIVTACLYTAEGKLLSRHNRKNVEEPIWPTKFPKNKDGFENRQYLYRDYADVFQCVKLDGETIGLLWIRTDLYPVYKQLKRNVGVLIVVILVAFAIAYPVSHKLQGIISKPLLELADVAITVSEQKDYSVRVRKTSNDEIGLLIDAFNEMLTQIHRRDAALVKAKEQLETKVRERTAELSTANELLKNEVAIRRTIQQQQQQLLEKLKAVNQELKEFAYVVSHDLKAPLRGISTIATWIVNDYKDKLDEEGKKQLELLLSRVNRMQNLIEGVLQYSRVGRGQEERCPVDLNALVAEIIDSIAPPEHIKIRVNTTLPTIICDRTRMTQLFQNLISNAVKYMDKPHGLIEIDCHDQENYWVFSVRDNGPGIEEKYFDKIFQIFQTLSPRDEYESTGVGLSLVKKIVELYGGKVWVESKVGHGSTFYFTLPKQERGVKYEKLQANSAS